MDLRNDYKVIYEHRTIVDTLTRHLKATKTIPAVGDSNVTYKDNLGATVSLDTIATFKLVYEKGGSIYGSTQKYVTANDTKILVYNGEDLVLGKIDKVAVTHNTIDGVTIAVSSVKGVTETNKVLVGDTVTIAVNGTGVSSTALPVIKVNGTPITVVSWVENKAQGTFVASVDTYVEVIKHA